MTHLRSSLFLALAAVLSFLAVTAAPSSATFTDRSANTATVTAAVDWVAPTVSLGPLTSPARGVVTVGVAAQDAQSSVARVAVEVRPTGAAAWSPLCTDTTAPFSCSWDTSRTADGSYEVRAHAVDAYDNVSGWVTAPLTVDNTAPSVTMVDPGHPLKGVRTFRAVADDALSGVATVTIYVYSQQTNSVQVLCTITSAPWSCSYDTDRLPKGQLDFRAEATDRAGNTAMSAWTSQ